MTSSALGGGLGRPRRSGIPLQKERGNVDVPRSVLHFVLESTVFFIRSDFFRLLFLSFSGVLIVRNILLGYIAIAQKLDEHYHAVV